MDLVFALLLESGSNNQKFLEDRRVSEQSDLSLIWVKISNSDRPKYVD